MAAEATEVRYPLSEDELVNSLAALRDLVAEAGTDEHPGRGRLEMVLYQMGKGSEREREFFWNVVAIVLHGTHIETLGGQEWYRRLLRALVAAALTHAGEAGPGRSAIAALMEANERVFFGADEEADDA